MSEETETVIPPTTANACACTGGRADQYKIYSARLAMHAKAHCRADQGRVNYLRH